MKQKAYYSKILLKLTVPNKTDKEMRRKRHKVAYQT